MWNVMQKLAVALGFVTVLGAGQARADIVKQQAPCASICAGLTPASGTTTARSVTFNAPGRGTLIVLFHGFLYCSSTAATPATIVVDSQIVEDDVEPDARGPSGLELYQSLEPGDTSQKFLTFNLASNRVFRINAAGSHVYRFRLTSGIPTNAGCAIYNGTFTTHFVE